MPDDDGVMLSEGEREAWAALASTIGDDWPADQIAGGYLARLTLPRWVAPVLLLLGAIITVVTFTRWLWVASLGLVLMGLTGPLTVQEALRRRQHPVAPEDP